MLKFGNRLVKPQRSIRVCALSLSPSSPSSSSLASSTRSSYLAISFSARSRRSFHTSRLSMAAHKIDGTAIAKYTNPSTCRELTHVVQVNQRASQE
jgi:hypothetical protein